MKRYVAIAILFTVYAFLFVAGPAFLVEPFYEGARPMDNVLAMHALLGFAIILAAGVIWAMEILIKTGDL